MLGNALNYHIGIKWGLQSPGVISLQRMANLVILTNYYFSRLLSQLAAACLGGPAQSTTKFPAEHMYAAASCERSLVIESIMES
jgi:hypothetical protein